MVVSLLDSEMELRRVRDEGLDKFYTSKPFAKECIEAVFRRYGGDRFDLLVEPSAGSGSFLHQLPEGIQRVGMALSPEDSSIRPGNFFEFSPEDLGDRVLVIGNPPFGRGCSLAIRFFNHAAQWASVIAFIVPRTFRRHSVQNRLDLRFRLESDTEVPTRPCVFHPAMSVKCCFQIWERASSPRAQVRMPTSHPDWQFLAYGPSDGRGQPTPPEGASFAIRAYGGNIGEIRECGLRTLRPKSWHWIRSVEDSALLKERFRSIDFSGARNTARQNSMGRADLVALYRSRVHSEGG